MSQQRQEEHVHKAWWVFRQDASPTQTCIVKKYLYSFFFTDFSCLMWKNCNFMVFFIFHVFLKYGRSNYRKGHVYSNKKRRKTRKMFLWYTLAHHSSGKLQFFNRIFWNTEKLQKKTTYVQENRENMFLQEILQEKNILYWIFLVPQLQENSFFFTDFLQCVNRVKKIFFAQYNFILYKTYVYMCSIIHKLLLYY